VRTDAVHAPRAAIGVPARGEVEAAPETTQHA
jgi:hypothetical protein